MLIEFDTIRGSRKESWEKEIQADLNGESSVPFQNSEDYMTQITVEMNNIIDFTGGRFWFNDKEYDCVYVNDENESLSMIPIMLSYKEFKKVFEYAKGVKILRHEEL